MTQRVHNEHSVDETVTLRLERTTSQESTTFQSIRETIHSTKRKYLYKFNEIPNWQRDNNHIWSGYVKETQSFRKCLYSLFYFHNESINVYSHLVPSIVYITLVFFLMNKLWVNVFPTTTFKDYIFINTFLIGCALCLMISGIFHCLKQHSEKQCKIWSKVDYLGIIILISCSMVSVIYYGYFDHHRYLYSFLTMVISLGVLCSLVVLNDTFDQNNWKPVRATFFILFALSGLIPLLFGIFKFGYLEVLNRICLKFIWLEAIFYILGAVLYSCKIPESWYPGQVDLWGNSHQMFHCMVVIGSICHCKAIIESYNLLHGRYD